MTGLDWIPLFESFWDFRYKARSLGLFSNELEYMEKKIAQICPLPKISDKEVKLDDKSKDSA